MINIQKNNKSVLSFQLRESVKRLADTQKRVEYIHSLRDMICMNFREMTEQEVTLEEKVCSHNTKKSCATHFHAISEHFSISSYMFAFVCVPYVDAGHVGFRHSHLEAGR